MGIEKSVDPTMLTFFLHLFRDSRAGYDFSSGSDRFLGVYLSFSGTQEFETGIGV